MPKDVTSGGSSAPVQDDELDLDGGQPSEKEPDPSPGNDEQTPAPSAEADPKAGEPKDEKKPTPLDELRQSLTKSAKTEEEPKDEDGDEPATDEGDTEEPPADGEDKPNKAAKSKPDADDADSPFKGFTPDERNALGRKASARIVELNTKTKAISEEAKKNEPFVKAGRYFEGIRAKSGMSVDDAVGAIELQHQYLRGDPAAIETLDAAADALRAALKMPARISDAPESADIAPFVGALPQEFEDMVRHLGMDETRVRMIAAFEKQQSEPKKEKPVAPKAPVTPQPVQRQQEFQPARTSTHVAGFNDDEVAAADAACADLLRLKGVTDDKLGKVMERLIPLMAEKAPTNPKTGKPDHRFIAPERRVKAMQIAHQRLVIADAAKAAEAKRRAVPAGSGEAPSVSGRRDSGASAKTPLDALRRQLVRA